MRATAKVTSKGQVTIPVDVREELGISTGDSLVFEVKAGYATVAKRPSVLEVAAQLRSEFPELSREPRYATKEEAIAAYFRNRAEEDDSRFGEEIYVVSARGTRVISPEGESEE